MIHLMTSHPKDASGEMITALANNRHGTKHFHLPLQSGSDKILKSMNRHYDKERYLSIVEELKSKIKDITFTTDIIVGFPGETDEDFEETIDIVKRVRFDSIFSFIYSPRKGTPAAEMEQVPNEVKHTRYDRLCQIQNEISNEINQTYVGKEIRVLVDGKSKNNENVYTSRTEGNKIVHFECENDFTFSAAAFLLYASGG